VPPRRQGREGTGVRTPTRRTLVLVLLLRTHTRRTTLLTALQVLQVRSASPQAFKTNRAARGPLFKLPCTPTMVPYPDFSSTPCATYRQALLQLCVRWRAAFASAQAVRDSARVRFFYASRFEPHSTPPMPVIMMMSGTIAPPYCTIHPQRKLPMPDTSFAIGSDIDCSLVPPATACAHHSIASHASVLTQGPEHWSRERAFRSVELGIRDARR
jgi:hypothetical protein